MKLADTIPFSAELLAPLHAERFAREGATAGPYEVTIDESWSVRPVGGEPAVRVAAELLRDHLVHSLGGKIGSGATDHPIVLRVEPTVGEHPETHLLRIEPQVIEVLGAGPAGVLHGVLRLIHWMRERGGPFLPDGETVHQPLFNHRIHRSPLSPFYVEELTGYVGPPFESRWGEITCRYPAWVEEDAGPDSFYHDHLLLRLVEHGFNGLWLRGAFRKFARVDVFPEFGPDAERILAALRRLTERAARFGLKVFLYVNEPMGLDVEDPFWTRYPHLRGKECRIKPVNYLCSSTDEVKEYLRAAPRYIFGQVPDLAGVMMITASEYPSHCWSHQRLPDRAEQIGELVADGEFCERCASRTPQAVIGEIVGLVREGAKAAKPTAEVIAWNWSWNIYEPDPQSGVLSSLPDDVIVMGDFERGQPTRALDFDYTNDEYSTKVIGPSPRFTGVGDFQRSRNQPVYAKIQIGTTHENPNVPYLPTLHKIAAKYQALVGAGVTGMMTCWNFGNMPSLATEVAGEMSWAPQPREVDQALLAVATRHFGPAGPAAVAAWRVFSRAQDDFPGSIPVMYYGPISRGPAFPFPFDRIDRKFPRSWMLDEVIDGDRLDWVGPFGAEKVVECFRAVAARWELGEMLMVEGLAKCAGDDRRRLERELGVATMCRLQIVSAANVVEFILHRDAFLEAAEADEKRRRLEAMADVCRAEDENARLAIPLCEADSRLGWHGEAYGHMISRALIERKLAGLDDILNRRIPEELGKLD